MLATAGSLRARVLAVGLAASVALVAGVVCAQRDDLSAALAREAAAGVESGDRFAEGPVRRGRLAAAAVRVPVRLRAGSCYELVVLTSDVGSIEVVLAAPRGPELARGRGERRVVVTHCADADVRATASLGPGSRPGRYALQLFAVNALRRAR